jgi:ketosteroid isomerase-like protein
MSGRALVGGGAAAKAGARAGLLLCLSLSLALPRPAHAADRQGHVAQGSVPEMQSPDRAGIDDAETQSAMAFLTALGRLDFEGAGAFLAEDAVLDLPYAGAGRRVTGRSQVLAFFRNTMTGKVGHIAYRLDHAYPGREPGVTVLEVSTKIDAAQGGAASNRLVAIFRFEGGKIVLFREYFNPTPLPVSARQ